MSSSVRAQLAAEIRPKLPASWVWHDYDKTPSTIQKPTAMLIHQRIAPGSVHGALVWTFSLVVLDPSTREDRADDNLDDHFEEVFPALLAIGALDFQQAEKGTRDGYPCWDFQFTTTTTF